MEIVNKDTLAFLKVLIKRHIIYRKKMHMDWSLHTTILIRNKSDFLYETMTGRENHQKKHKPSEVQLVHTGLQKNDYKANDILQEQK